MENSTYRKFLIIACSLQIIACSLSAQSFAGDFACDFVAKCGNAPPQYQPPIASKKCVFSVFPNPTSDILSIEPTPQYCALFDVSGRRIRTGFDVSDLAQGVYFLHIRDGDCRTIRKVVKL
jgi:hypothetical protein